MKEISKSWLRYIFIAVFLGLFAQYYFAMKYEEPFPAIMMPRFTYQEIQDSVISFPQVEIQLTFEDSSSIQIDKHILFSEIHLPQRNKVLRRIFQHEPLKETSAELDTWLRKRMIEISGRQDLERLDFNWKNSFWKFGKFDEAIKEETIGFRKFDLSFEK